MQHFQPSWVYNKRKDETTHWDTWNSEMNPKLCNFGYSFLKYDASNMLSNKKNKILETVTHTLHITFASS